MRDIAANRDGSSQCLHAWRLTDPREDKDRILSSKDPLLEDSWTWILKDRAFTDWWEKDESSILWIHGDPGKGKTMMMIALINEIQRRLDLMPQSGVLSYFFCQNTVQELNNAVSIVRGLTYLLAKQNPALTRHLQKRYDETDSRPFEGLNALHGLWKTLSEIVQDSLLSRVYLMVDALDECDPQSLETFLKLLRESRLSNKVKWVVASRNESKMTENLQHSHLGYDTSLELNSSHVSEAVKSFISFKVDELNHQKKYGEELQSSVREYLTTHADGTFLWVALVCKELEKVPKWRTLDVCRKFPARLEPLYRRMMEQIKHDKDPEEVEVYLQTLRTVTLACRPLHLREMAVIAGLPQHLTTDDQALQDIAGSCGSFLIVREQNTVYFVHQSAKDYFTTGVGSSIFPSGQTQAHSQLACQLMQLMSESLKTDVCGLQRPGTLVQEIESGIVGRCLPGQIQYACCYWVHHLAESAARLEDNGQVHVFLQKHLLHWLEALSIIKRISDGILMLTDLQGIVKVSDPLDLLLDYGTNV